MSGGPYGRGKAPERACLKLEAWPEQDRRLWQAACEPGDLLAVDEGGARANRATATNYKAEKGYGRWLTFLKTVDAVCLVDPPGDAHNSRKGPSLCRQPDLSGQQQRDHYSALAGTR